MFEFNLAQLRQGDRRMLARTITLLESRLAEDSARADDIVETIFPYTGDSIRIGISGAPGVGKSTFIETFGMLLLELGKKVAVLAVDPSSPTVGGSILGDKTRMAKLANHTRAFVRPSPASGSIGGVHQKTREAMFVCEVAGFDIVIVETVGVGQSEYEVASMVDFFMVLLQPNLGDELQGLKKGILELVHAIVINKADGENTVLAEQTKHQYQSALQFLTAASDWRTKVSTCSALDNLGIGEIWSYVTDFFMQAKASGEFAYRRAQQNERWMTSLLNASMYQRLERDAAIQELKRDLTKQVVNLEIPAYVAAKKIIALLNK